MYTKIMFYDDEGDLIVDYVLSAFKKYDANGNLGLCINITDSCAIFFKEGFNLDDLLKKIFDWDKVDLTKYGPCTWIDEDGNWSEPTEESYNKCRSVLGTFSGTFSGAVNRMG